MSAAAGRIGLFIGGAIALAVLCLLWPAAAATVEILRAAAWETAAMSPRRWMLLGRGVDVALRSGAVATILGGGLAVGLAARSAAARWTCAAVGLVVLLTPPYVYAYAWSLPALPGGLLTAQVLSRDQYELVTRWRATWCLGTWSAPLAAAVIFSGWQGTARRVYQLALLDASPARALLRGALPTMTPAVLAAFGLSAGLALSEFSVCHLCLVQTWNTEILAEAQLGRAGTALLLGWPLAAAVGAVVLALLPVRKRLAELLARLSGNAATSRVETAATRQWPGLVVAGLAAAVLLLPWAVYLSYLSEPAALLRAWRTFVMQRDQAPALPYAVAAAVAGVWLALGVDFLLGPRRADWPVVLRGAGWAIALAALAAALMPPVVVGDAFVAAYHQAPAVYDHWPILSLALAARLAIVPIGLLVAARARVDGYAGMAAADGASWWQCCRQVRWPLMRGALMKGGLLVAVLALTEVAVSQMVTPPSVNNVARRLLNEIHFGRNDDVIALSLYMTALAALGAGGLLATAGRRARL
ncbi:MAG: hypothetical protein LC135_00965 [Phycisphaerae bacterium]|nr:hypothetical protein [Phycisphaerae bacterium]MCZ2398422.1 hypothetical protein [Phycisphaerae bacterium]